ncbi:unnamed protein product [Adineta steineri]|uniref:Poly [ADP-ribose] polymerase n=1 Tax=Adineta steineri TaxID=433720 RepID=A0A814EYS1_9BILA|nr:unnamed protein product [Adineta steineri]
MDDECGFRAEYAKSDRSTCKGCRSTINKDSLRLAIMVQSPNFDGKIPTWYHMTCFFKKVKPADAQIIKGYEDLRWDDQEKLRQKVEGKSTKDSNNKSDENEVSSTNYSAEYARSSRSTCNGCNTKIEKDLVRLSIKVLLSHTSIPTDQWYHIDCFKEHKEELNFNGNAETFEGFNNLNKEDQTELKKKFGSTTVNRKRKGDKTLSSTGDNDEAPKAKQTKTEDKNDATTEQDEIRQKKEQSELLWKYKDALKKEVPNDVLKELLEHNQQKIVTGESHLIDTVADCMAFGSLEHCPECGGFLIFNYTCYRCTGDVTEWTKCSYTTTTPTRKLFDIPNDIKTEYDAFKSYKYKKRDRILAKVIENHVSIAKTPEVSRVIHEPIYDSNLPLSGYVVSSAGRLSSSVANIQKEVERLGGTFSSKIDDTVGIVISSQDEIKKMSKKLQDAQTSNIHIVSEEFLKEIVNDRPSIIMEKCKISTWGILPHIRQQTKADEEAKLKSGRQSLTTASTKSDSRSKKSVPDKMKLKLKDGAAVDPESGLEDICHVLRDTESNEIFACVLGLVDITRGTNSYYKLQLLESDNGRQWFVFRAWGRTGTVYGGNKVDEYSRKTDAIKAFHELFLEKTGNEWGERKNFQKLPNKHYPLEIDYGQHGDNDKMQKLLENANLNIKSKLPNQVQDLVKMIFNVETMKQALLSFEIDLTKMPLGKLSKNQLDKAYKVLSELQTIITNGVTTSKTAIVDASNRFYTLIPHDFGLAKPPLLDNVDLIKTKTEMIDNLLEIEIAYSMLDESNNTIEDSEHPIDAHYRKLKCGLIPVEHNTEEFKLIEQYMIKTHAKTHDQYTLKLCELFKTTREGEYDRFKNFQTLDNHQLLWHGSRTTNFAGILSQGLRIAPPEAPVTGYMFGKGVYFADMVSKSANYCFTTKHSPQGLMLLCEVALGKMFECLKATNMSASTLPHGTHSTKGCGSTMPDPKDYHYTNDGILIPMGNGVASNARNTSLLYNEYIVYNTDQINMKYLLRVDFQYKY